MCLAIPGEVTALHERDGLRMATVRFGGVSREVCLEYEPDTQPGDFVLVHVGFAIGKIDKEAAAETWKVLEAIGETDDLRDEAAGAPERPDRKAGGG